MGEKKTPYVFVNIPRIYIEKIDILVQKKIFTSRAEAVREAIRKLLESYGVQVG